MISIDASHQRFYSNRAGKMKTAKSKSSSNMNQNKSKFLSIVSFCNIVSRQFSRFWFSQLMKQENLLPEMISIYMIFYRFLEFLKPVYVYRDQENL
jgi:hypothetical protein